MLGTGTPAADSNVKTAAGTNTVAGPVTYNSLLINGGSVTAPGTTDSSITGSGTLTISSGALANVQTGTTGTSTVSGFSSIIFGNGSSNTATTVNEAIITNVNQNAAGTLTISSPIDTFAAGGGLTKAGAGNLILTGANLYTGVTTINAGTLTIGNGTSGSLAAGSGAVTINPGTTLALIQPTGSTFANNIVNNGALAITNAGAQTFSGNISGVSGITQATTGTTLTLAGTNTYTGATAVSAGTLALTGSITGSNVVVSGTGVFNEAATGVIGGTGNTFTLTAGTATLAGQNTYTGNTTFTAGTLNIAGDGTATSGPLGTGTLAFVTGGTLQATGGAHAISNNITNNGSTAIIGGTNNLTLNGVYSTLTSGTVLTVNNTGLTTFAGGMSLRGDSTGTNRTVTLAGSGPILISGVVSDGIAGTSVSNLTYTGSNTVTLTAANTYTGNTTISSGTLQLGNGGTTGSLAGPVIDNATFIINRSNAISQANAFGVISGTGAVTLNGTGTTTFTAANTYSGATTINRGTLNLGGGTATGSINGTPGTALVLGGGTLNFTRTGTAAQTFTGTTLNSGGSGISTALSTETLNLGAITRNTGGTVNFTNAGTITTTTANTATSILGGWATYGLNNWAVSASNGTAAGNITALGTYFVSDDVANLANNTANSTSNVTDSNGFNATYTNNLTINSLRFNSGVSDSNFGIVNNNNLTLVSGGILVTNSVGQKYQRIGFLNTNFNAGEGQGGLTSSATDLVVNQNNSSTGHLEIYAAVFGNIGLTKSGAGYLELRGLDASYTGVTTVNGGTMLLTAATTGTSGLVVNNTGVLQLGANDRISNTNATNVQNVPVTLNSGTINTGGFKEGNSDGANAATQGLGALTLSYSSTLDFGAGHSGSSVLAFAASNTQSWTGTLTLLDFTPGTDFLNFASSTGLTATQLGEISLSGFTVSGLDSFGNLTFTAVPEPATWAVGVLLVGMAGWQFRRRSARRAA